MSLGNINRALFKALIRPLPVCNSTRLYGRWMHRKPAKVLLPFEPPSKINLKKEKVIDLDPQISKRAEDTSIENNVKTSGPSGPSLPTKKSESIKQNRDDKLKKRKFYLSQQKVFDDNHEVIYEKLKEKDGRISTLLTSLKSKKERLKTRQVMVEGWRLIVDGLEAQCNLRYVIFSRVEDLNNLRPFLPKTGVKLFKIPYKEIELWSSVETSPGIFGVFEMPSQENVKRLSRPLPLNFICDNIRVPGNLGAILRAALGAGCDKVMLTKGCVDVWEPKVLRCAAGAHFRLSIYNAIDWEEMPNLMDENTSIFIADSNANVLSELESEDKSGMHLPVVPYYSVEYSSMKHITLIIGGETEGISEESYSFAASNNGLRLHIPLEKGIDSLNTGMATAVIAFEIRKQLIQAWTKLKLDRHKAEAT